MIHAKVLVVDHVIELEMTLEYLEFMDPQLQRAGLKLEAVGANNFDMAIRLLQEDSFDLIISHLSLEGNGDGGKLISRVRLGEFVRDQLGTAQSVPAIGTTGHVGSALYERMLNWGFDMVLFSRVPKDLIRAIFSILKIEPSPF